MSEGTFMPKENRPDQKEINSQINRDSKEQTQSTVQTPKKSSSTKTIIAIVIGVGCFFITFIGILALVILLALSSARNRANDSKVKAAVNSLAKSEEVYYDDHTSYTDDFDTLMKDSVYIYNQPVHKGTDTYGIIVTADKKNYKIEGHLGNGSIYTCSQDGCK